MAKINHIIAEYKETLAGFTELRKTDSLPTPVIKRFVRIFTDIDDSRCQGMTVYPLEEILLTVFLAVLANASTWADIEQFGHEKLSWLRTFCPFENGTPSHDTFRRVFSLLNSAQLEKATVSFLMANIEALKYSLSAEDEDDYRLICVDGKEEKGTGRKYGTPEEVRNLQTLHVYDASSEVCLFSKPIDSKTNEIPVAQELLQSMNLKGCIVTFDALHTQKDTISIICDAGGDYVGGLKGNQSSLLADVELTFGKEYMSKLEKSASHYLKQVEKSHGKVETRQYYMTEAAFGSSKNSDWKKLKTFILLIKTTVDMTTQKECKETRYYIASLSDINLCAEAIRGHWSVENKLHWHLDYSFSEDDNSTMDKKAFTNLSLINKMCLSLCKLAQPLMGKSSLRVIRKRFSWNLEGNLSLLLNTFDEAVLRETLVNANKKKKG